MKGWNDLGVVDTIFEEDNEDLQSFSSPPLSPPLSSSASSPLQSAVDEWTTTTGKIPDVKIHVQGICFHLHKDLLISKSSYLKRKLIGVSEYTLSPPLKIAAETFKQVADFCYTSEAVITPFNVAALRTAVELLGMDDEDINGGDGESLRQRTESYFCVMVAIHKDFACKVFHSCLSLLPEAEQTAFLPSRCLEALFELDDGDDDGDGNGNGDGIVSVAEGLKTVSPEDFRVIADSMQRRFAESHNVLYRVVDLYFLVYKGKISEDQKTQICNTIDCSILSSPLLMHAVQNPRMPLRFIVQAMLIEQLNTHRSIFSALNTATTTTTTSTRPYPRLTAPSNDESPATLGAILERDAALRQVAQLRATIDTTSSRIQNLERELTGMKQLLVETADKEKQKSLVVYEQPSDRRSSSCRFEGGNGDNNKVRRGERGSVSASMLRFRDVGVKTTRSSSSCLGTGDDQVQGAKVVKRSLGQRLIRGLKTAFGASFNKNSKDGKDQEQYVGMSSRVLDLEAYQSGDSLHHRTHSVS